MCNNLLQLLHYVNRFLFSPRERCTLMSRPSVRPYVRPSVRPPLLMKRGLDCSLRDGRTKIAGDMYLDVFFHMTAIYTPRNCSN